MRHSNTISLARACDFGLLRLRFAHKATITKVSFEPAFLLLSSTIFHPQGGGQPSDTGKITLAGRESTFSVSMCKVDRDIDDIVHEVCGSGNGMRVPAVHMHFCG